MSVYASLDGSPPTMLASNSGWSDLVSWVDTLNVDEYTDLAVLADHGWSEQLDKVQSQLKRALASPPSDDIAHTAGELLDLISGRGEATVLTIGDGLAKDTAT